MGVNTHKVAIEATMVDRRVSKTYFCIYSKDKDICQLIRFL